MSNNLMQQWLEAKQAEQAAINTRRKLEDEMIDALNLQSFTDGTFNHEAEGFKAKVTARLTRSVDSDLLQEIAAENGLTEHIGRLFRWKPSIDLNAWKAADSSITKPLEAAITTKAGRPSFSITKTDEV